MGTQHTTADGIVYDLVSVQYHALKAAQTYDKYIKDAADHADVRGFLEECAEQDGRRQNAATTFSSSSPRALASVAAEMGGERIHDPDEARTGHGLTALRARDRC